MDTALTLRTPGGSPGFANPLTLVALVLAMLVAFSMSAFADPKFPPLTGRIVDEANILSAQDRRELEEILRQLEGKSSDQFVIYTTPSLQGYEIEDFGYRLGRFWKIGQGSINNGILLIVAPNERKVRIEVGRGLEGQMTDLMSGTIIRNAILPAFRRGDFPAGIKAGARDIKDVLLGDAEEVRKRAQSIKPRQPTTDWTPLIMIALFVGVWLFFAYQEQKQAASMPSNMNRRRHGNVQPGRGRNQRRHHRHSRRLGWVRWMVGGALQWRQRGRLLGRRWGLRRRRGLGQLVTQLVAAACRTQTRVILSFEGPKWGPQWENFQCSVIRVRTASAGGWRR